MENMGNAIAVAATGYVTCPNYPAPWWFNFACGAKYPHQALKGGYFVFVFVWRVGTCDLTLDSCLDLT